MKSKTGLVGVQDLKLYTYDMQVCKHVTHSPHLVRAGNESGTKRKLRSLDTGGRQAKLSVRLVQEKVAPPARTNQSCKAQKAEAMNNPLRSPQWPVLGEKHLPCE